jgi:hypothetical protein
MSRVFEELERFVPKEHKDEYRKFVAYSVQFKPNDEIGQICHAAGWLALITRETPGAFAKNAEAFLTEWKKEQTQLLRVVGSFKDDQVRLSTKHEELRTLIDEGGRSLAALFTNERAKTSLFLKESRVQETSVKQVCADLKQAVTSAKADIESATTTAIARTQKELGEYYSASSWIFMGITLLTTGVADLLYPQTGFFVCFFGIICLLMGGCLKHYLKDSSY